MEYYAHSAKDGFPAQTYEDHVRNVQRRAHRYASEASGYYSGGDSLIRIVDQAAQWHDLGKLDPENQNVLKSPDDASSLPVNHVDAGTLYLGNREAPYSALLVYSHHRGLPDMAAEYSRGNRALRDDKEKTRNRTEKELPDLVALHKKILGSADAECDPEPEDLDKNGYYQVFLRMALSCLADSDHSDTSENYGAPVSDEHMIGLRPEERLEALDRYVAALKDNGRRSELRSQMYESCRNHEAQGGFISCDSPVGSGKTTSVMAHLLRQACKRGSRRIFVILPYTNIIQQSVEIYRRALVLPGEDPESVVAELHHRADFENEDLRRLTALWRAPIIVTTAVAFFETLASNRPSTLRRLHELPGSVIFIDEAHAALPLNLLPVAWQWMNILSEQWGCYWVLASGSLVRFWEIPELTDIHPDIPELVNTDLHDDLMKYEEGRIDFLWNDKPQSREDLENWVTTMPGPRLLIMNTVQSAAVIARDLRERGGAGCVEHLSSSLTAVDKAKTIDRVRKRLQNRTDTDWTLVATSCVEAGVDFSFRTGFREVSSLLSLLQASGRVSRGGEYTNAQMWSFTMQDDPLLKRNPGLAHSSAILQGYLERGIPITPELSTKAIYDEINQYDEDMKKRKELLEEEADSSFSQIAENFHVIESDTVPVIISPDVVEQICSGNADWKLVQKNSVSISKYNLKKWNVSEISRDLYVWTHQYDDFLGYMAGVIPLAEIQEGGSST